MTYRIEITDDRIKQLVLNNPVAYRMYSVALQNKLTYEQFLAELTLLLAKSTQSEIHQFATRGAEMSYGEAIVLADSFNDRYKQYVPQPSFGLRPVDRGYRTS